MKSRDVVGSVAVQGKSPHDKKGGGVEKVLMTRNKQYALKVLGCQQASNTGRLVFFSGNISGTVIQQEQPGCIGADSLSGSYFPNHFHDKLFIPDTSGAVAESHVLSGKTTPAYRHQQRVLTVDINLAPR